MRLTFYSGFLLLSLFSSISTDTDAANLVSAAAPGQTTVDVRSAGWSWKDMTEISDPSLVGGSGRAGGQGAYASYAFQGTGVEIHVMTGPSVLVSGISHKMGHLQIKFDGAGQDPVPLTGITTNYNYTAFQAAGLKPGYHIVELTVSDGWMVLGYLRVTSAGISQPTPNMGTTPGLTCTISNVRSGLLLDESDAFSDTGCHATQSSVVAGRSKQFWTVRSTGDGHWTLKNAGSGQYLSDNSSTGQQVQWVIESNSCASNYQQWRIDRLSDGIYALTNRGSGYCLNVFQNATSAGAWMNVDKWNNDPSEEWVMRQTK